MAYLVYDSLATLEILINLCTQLASKLQSINEANKYSHRQ
jgi:hypothetical protein